MPDFGSPFKGVDLGRNLTKEELLRALRFVVSAEFEAVQLYTQLANASDDPEVKKVLRDVADEEIVHAGEFLALVKKINPEEEKLYNKGEKETEKLIKEGIQAFKSARDLDKVADSLEELDPKTAIVLDKMADGLETFGLSVIPKSSSDKPEIFKRTIYRQPTEDELIEVDDFKLTSDKIIKGFYYTLVGKGLLGKEQKDLIIKSIENLIKINPDNNEYKKALSEAKKLKR